MKFFAVLAAALVASSAQAQDTIKIGVITDRVGVSKPYSEPATEGMVFGANEINKKGGVLGKKLELLIEDDQSKPDVSAALARKLIDQGAVFILSVSLSPATQQQQTVTMEAKTPQMTPMNSAAYLTTQLDNPYFWQTGPLGSVQIATLLAHARKQNLKSVALIPHNSAIAPAIGKESRSGRAETGKEPANLHGYGYDGIMLVAEAIRRAGSTDKEKIRAAMQSLTYGGVMGAKGMKYHFPDGKRTGFDPNGMVVRVYEGDRQGRVVHVGVQ